MAGYKKCYFIFLTGALGYCLLEILWRGYIHPSMGIAGGISLVGIYYISKLSCSRLLRAVLSTILITVTELIFGIFLNIIFHLNIWDYSKMPFNFMGQICLSFSFLWFVLSYISIFTFDFIKKRQV